jgi:GH43 family beta-xylosidase
MTALTPNLAAWITLIFLSLGTTVAAGAATFTQPIRRGADPWVVRHGDYYWWAFSEQAKGIRVHRSRTLTQPGEGKVVWTAPETGPYSKQVWAPEIHFIGNRAYLYVAASDGRNENHRMFVLESATDDPLGSYAMRGELYTGDDVASGTAPRWAIDGTVLQHESVLYFVWSGWHDEMDVQFLYLARMANPWTISSNRVKLAANDDYLWERVGDKAEGRGLHEAPQILEHDGRVFIIYSASASWLPTYKLGLLALAPGSNLMDPKSWRKFAEPVFASTDQTFGVGHGAFVRSPDGREWWHTFHAKVSREPGFDRNVFLQPFRWNAAGFPDFGKPLSPGAKIPVPSGEVTNVKP